MLFLCFEGFIILYLCATKGKQRQTTMAKKNYRADNTYLIGGYRLKKDKDVNILALMSAY